MVNDTPGHDRTHTPRPFAHRGDSSPGAIALTLVFCVGMLITLLLLYFVGFPTRVSGFLLLLYIGAWSSAWIALGLLVLRYVWSLRPWWLRILPTLCIAVTLLELVGGFASIGIAPSLTGVFARLYYPAGNLGLALLLLSLFVGLLAHVRRRRRGIHIGG